MPISPLQPLIPIVDAAGRPTPEFIQQWEKLRALVANVSGVAGTYAPPASVTVDERGRITQISE